MASTNVKGEAAITSLPERDSIIISHVAYQEIKTTKAALAAAGNKIFMVENAVKLNEIVFSANRKEESKDDIPTMIEVISAKRIAFANPQNSAELLAQTGKVFVQQSQMGAGSPVLRGFEANKVLLVVDGVRMNNAIYRSGHLQNAITIDPNMLERAEVIYGPGSVIYGSDALGGTMHFFTRQPVLSASGKPNIQGTAFTRYATANQEKTGHFNLNLGFRKWGFLSSFTYKDFGDMRAGNIRNPFYGDFGKRTFYAERVNGRDSMFLNPDPNIQRQSAYSQYDMMQKILFKPNENSSYTLNFQYSNSSDINRYDRLTETRNNLPRFSEWYYGPQTRLLTSLRADFRRTSGLFDNATIIAAYQNIKESRVNRNFGSTNRNHRLEDVDVFSVNFDFNKDITDKNELRYGFESYYNFVGSTAFSENIESGAKGALDTRYPDGGSNMYSAAAYVTHNWELSKTLILSQGIRYSFIGLESKFIDVSRMAIPFTQVRQQNGALNGNIGLVYLPGNSWKLSAMASNGFRAANVDDMGKVFERSTGIVVVPVSNLQPEYATNAELGIAKTLNEKIQISTTGFYTWYRDAIVLRPYRYNGQDSILYEGNMVQVQANTNAENAIIYGLQGDISAQVTTAFSISSSLTYTYGKVTGENVPLGHIPPIFGQTSFQLEMKRFKGEFFVRYNGWKHLHQYSPSTEDNIEYATQFGMPAWYTLNVRTDFQLTQWLKLQTGLENILDTHYRVFASGISAPGRNLYVAVRAIF